MSADGQGTKCRRHIVENFNRLSRAHEHYRRQTDIQTDRETTDRRTGISYSESSRWIKTTKLRYAHKLETIKNSFPSSRNPQFKCLKPISVS